MTDDTNVIDLNDRRNEIEDERDAVELMRRVAAADEEHGRWLTAHAAEMLADAILTYDEAKNDHDHIWYLRRAYGERILEWARTICPLEAE